jgi:hypothetical protein
LNPSNDDARKVPPADKESIAVYFSHSPIDMIPGARHRLAADVLVERLGLSALVLDLENEFLPDPSARFCTGPTVIIRMPLFGAHRPFRELCVDPSWGHLLLAADRSILTSAGKGSRVLIRVVRCEAQLVQLWFSTEKGARHAAAPQEEGVDALAQQREDALVKMKT